MTFLMYKVDHLMNKIGITFKFNKGSPLKIYNYKYLLLLTLSFFSFLVNAQATNFIEGKHYQTIQGAQTKQKEITEFFSFYCPHCFRREPIISELLQSIPSDVVFKKNHVNGMPGRKISIEDMLTKALLTAKILHLDDKMIPAIFNYIHLRHANFDNLKDIKNLFMLNGVEGNKFDKIFASFSVNREFKTMNHKTEILRQQGITSVPTLIINGKYKINDKNIKDMDEYKTLVNFLLTKKA